MKVFIDLYALLSDISLNKWIAKISEGKMISLPYNSNTINLLNEHYKSFRMVILAPTHMEDLAQQACNEIERNFNFYISYKCFESIEEKAQELTGHHYVTNTYDKCVFKSEKFSFIGTIFGLFPFYFFKNRHFIRWNTFGGAFSVFWEFFQLFVPIIILWPALIGPYHVVNTTRLTWTVINCMATMFFSGMLRTLLELDNERQNYLKGYNLLCGNVFIEKPNLIAWALFYGFISILLICFIIFKEPYTIFATLIIGFVNFGCFLMPMTIKYFFIILSMILVNIICQFKFIKWLFIK